MKIRDVTDEEQKTRKEENTMHLRKDETMLEDIQKIKKDINLLLIILNSDKALC